MVSRRLSAVAFFLATLAIVLPLSARPSVPGVPPNRSDPSSRLDINGEPLPQWAVSRAGMLRFRQPGDISQIAFSPDGRTVLTACALSGLGQTDKFARAWSIADGRESRRFGDHAAVTAVAISPDGKVVATREESDRIRLWDAANGKEIRQIAAPFPPGKLNEDVDTRYIDGPRFGSDGKSIVVAYFQHNTAILWDTATGKELRRWSSEPNTVVGLSGDGKHLVIPGANELRIVESASDKIVQTISLGTDAQLSVEALAVTLAPGGKTLVTATGDHAVRLWDVASAKELWKTEMPGYTFHLAFTPDGSMLATVSYSYDADWAATVAILDAKTGKELRRLDRMSRNARAVAFSPDGKTLVTGCGNALRFWDPATGKEMPALVTGHSGAITTVSVSRDGGMLATCSDIEKVIRLWDTATGREMRKLEGHEAGVDEVTISPDGKLLASAAKDQVFVWELATGKLLHRIDSHPAAGPYLRFSDDSKTLATGSKATNTLLIWDCATNRVLRDVEVPPKGLASLLTFDDGRLLAFETPTPEGEEEDAAIALWDLTANRLVRRFTGHKGKIGGVILSADGRMLASRGSDKTIRVWEVATGAERCRFQEPGEIQRTAEWTGTQFLAFSPNGRMLVTAATDDPLVRRWDLAAAKELPPLAGHLSWIGAIEFSANGRTLVTGSQDTTVLVWDGAAIGISVPPNSRLTDAELNSNWDDLADRDAAKAYHAIFALARAGDQAARFIGGKLGPAANADAGKVKTWIDALDDSQFAAREKATAALVQVAGQAEEALRAELKRTQSAEVRQRIGRILDANWDVAAWPDRLREIRAVEAIEAMTTPAARECLTALSRGAPGALLTREARIALKRFDGPSPSAHR